MNSLARWTLIGCLAVAGCAGGSSTAAAPASPEPPTAVPPTAVPRVRAAAWSNAVEMADPSDDAWTMAARHAPGYLDVVAAEVTKASDGTFEFVMTLASAFPPAPQLRAGETALGWAVCIDVYPFVVSPLFGQVTIGMPCQFIVQTLWDGARLSGQLIDRRSVGAGDPAVALAFDPVVEGTSIHMSLPAVALGGPTWFLWSMFTEEFGPVVALDQPGALGPNAAHHTDAVPDGGVGAPLAWPRS